MGPGAQSPWRDLEHDPWFGVPSDVGTSFRKWLHLFVLLRSGNYARCLLEGSVLTLAAHASHCCQDWLGWWLWRGTGPCPVVLRASGLQWGQGDRSLSHKVTVPGTPRGFLVLVLPGPPFTRWELGTSPTPSASHPAQGSSGVPSEPRWGAGCWNRVQ